MRRWQHSSMKCAALSALSENRMPLLPRMPTGMPCDMREAGDQRRAVQRLELVEFGGVDQPRDHLAHVVLLARVGRHDAVELGRGVLRIARRDQRDVDVLLGVEVRHRAPRERERVHVVRRQMVGDAGCAGVHVGAAEILRRHHLAGRGLHQRRPAEEDRALPFDDDGLVRHRRHVGAARGARAHHHGDLRNAGGRHGRLVVEDAAEMLAVGEHLGLMRQVGAAAIDQVDAGQPVLARDLLRAQVLLHRHRVIGAALDGAVVAHDHAFAALDAADAGDQSGAVDRVVVHAVGGERRQFEERRAGIEQLHDALARQQLAARTRDARGRAAGPPSAASARRFASSSDSARIRAALARNSSEPGSMVDSIGKAIPPCDALYASHVRE